MIEETNQTSIELSDNQGTNRNPDGTWKEGVSGNPAGKPSGIKDFKTLFIEAIKKIAKERHLDPDSVEIDLVVRAIAEARAGNFKYYQDILDRKFGKPQQTLRSEMSGTLKIEKLKDIDESLRKVIE